jgi:glycosyltransferase involved in cell wall biosynthesis
MKSHDDYFASIIVPTLNEEEFIGNLLKSLQNQTYKNFEVIIVDGGSYDNTLKIAQEHNAKTIAKPNTPEFESRNIGGKLARGEILLFTSADVVFRTDTILRVIQEFENDKSLGAICGPGKIYNAPLWAKIEYTLYYTLLGMWTKITKDFHGSTNFMAVRKQVFNKIGGFKERIDADGYFLNEVTNNTKGKFISNFSILISGRRAKKMGFIGFNTHFFYALDAFFPLLRETILVKTLENYSVNYRKKQKATIHL